MRRLVGVCAALAWAPVALAGVTNVEFEFTPYTGKLDQEQVEKVPGKARVYLNGALYVEQEVVSGSAPVMFDEREVAGALWITGSSMGPQLRKGRNHLRIEFEPANPKLAYTGQLRWSQVTDQVAETDNADGSHTSSNMSGEGREDKPATGKLVLERDFEADFAADLKWHHHPAPGPLSEADRAAVAALLKARGEGFKPGFEQVYSSLAAHPEIQLAEVRKLKCLDAAWTAGIRVAPVPAEQLVFETGSGPEVLVHGSKQGLYDFGDRAKLANIPGDDMQMCAAMVLSVAYPERVAVVRNPSGGWEVAY
jgi:hypothetical protein